MAQCSAFWRPRQKSPVCYACVLDSSHAGPHVDMDGRKFEEYRNIEQFMRDGYTKTRNPKNPSQEKP